MRKAMLVLLLLVVLTGCGKTEGEVTTQVTEVTTQRKTEVVTTTEKKTTEVVTTENVTTEIVTTEGQTTEEVTTTEELTTEELTTEELTTEELTTEELTTEEISTEESTGEIDVNGYGWVQLQHYATYHIMDDHLTRSNGVVYCFGHRETWYSTNEASGQETARDIPGKHVAEDGTIRDEDGYVCVASSDLSFYSIVMTSVGPGKVYDCGCSSGTIDVYTNW